MYVTIEEYQKHLNQIRNLYLTQKGESENLKKMSEAKEKTIKDLEKESENLLIGKKIIEDACKEAREQGRQMLEQMSSGALDFVFKDDSSVALQLNENSQNISLDVRMTTKDDNGNTVMLDPNLDGGGLRDILSTAFLVSIGCTVKDNYAPLVLDEPSKFVSKGTLAENFAAYMKDLSICSDKQMIVSTHDEALLKMGDTKHHIVKVGNYSEVTKEV